MQKLKTLPKQLAVAVSGGVDSTVLLHFLRQNYQVTALHYVHDSDYAETEQAFVTGLCKQWSIPLVVERQPKNYQAGQSREAYWRAGRYQFFKSQSQTVCVGTNLDDAVEWYLFSCLRGQGHYMEYANENVVKPLLTTTKEEIYQYAKDNSVPWIEDPSNINPEFCQRNLIRAELVPAALRVNPGLYSVVKKRIVEKTHGTGHKNI